MKIECLTPAQWAPLSENAHRACFGKVKPAAWDRIDFALLAVEEETATVRGYGTFREQSRDSVYWQFGGAFPGAKDTALSFRAYQQMVRHLAKKYTRVTTAIENTNTVMLKFAMKVGYRIVGTRTVDGSVMVEHLLEFQKEIP